MNDWDDMNEEVKMIQSPVASGLDETRILDSNNVHGRNMMPAAARGGFHQIGAASDNLIDGADRELQESVVMSFGDNQTDQNHQPMRRQQQPEFRIDINEVGHAFSAIASVKITDFDWKYEK